LIFFDWIGMVEIFLLYFGMVLFWRVTVSGLESNGLWEPVVGIEPTANGLQKRLTELCVFVILVPVVKT
jgi:hypothetical protein